MDVSLKACCCISAPERKTNKRIHNEKLFHFTAERLNAQCKIMSKNVYYFEKYVFFDIISSIHSSRTAALLRSYVCSRFHFWAIITSTVAVEHNCNVPVLIFNTVNSVVILGNFKIERHIYHGFSTDL